LSELLGVVNEGKELGMQRSKYSSRSVLMAALAMAMTTPGLAEPALTLRTAGSGNNRRPNQPKRDTALQREIADHNAAVEARQAAKRDRKRWRTG
jgi:hypothetical protein